MERGRPKGRESGAEGLKRRSEEGREGGREEGREGRPEEGRERENERLSDLSRIQAPKKNGDESWAKRYSCQQAQ